MIAMESQKHIFGDKKSIPSGGGSNVIAGSVAPTPSTIGGAGRDDSWSVVNPSS